IVAVVPAGATSGNIVVTVGGVATNGMSFVVLPTPTLTDRSPAAAPLGAAVTITGTNFGPAPGTSAVKFNGVVAASITWSDTSVTVLVPSGATTGNIVVTVNGVTSNALPFTVLPTPTLVSRTPASGQVGTIVSMTGSNFGAT